MVMKSLAGMMQSGNLFEWFAGCCAPLRRKSLIWHRSSASAVPARLSPMGQLTVVPRTFQEIGRAAASIFPPLVEAVPTIGEFETTVVMHNDVVVLGLSEVPSMQDIEKWGVLTIGTGLGNALFANRK
jgi:hypothetical protein